MFRTLPLSYFKYGFRFLTVTHPKTIIVSSVRCCSIKNFSNDLRKRRHNEVVKEKRVPSSTNSRLSKSVLFPVDEEALTPLNSCSSVEDVLDYIRNNPKVDIQLYALVFNTIFKLYKSGNTKLSAELICRREEFENLSRNVKEHVRFLKVEDAITILKVLTYFGISTNSILGQSLLQMISKQINRLGIKQILFLHFILTKSTQSPLTEGLKIAIPIVFEAHVRSQLDEDDTSLVTDALCFILEKKFITPETRDLLVNLVLKKPDEFKLYEIYGIVKRLSFGQNGPENLQNLHKKLVNILTENMDKLTSSQIIKLVTISLDKYLYVHESFFNDDLLKKSVQHVINGKLDIIMTSKFLQQLDRVSYYCPELLNYVDEYFVQLADFGSISSHIFISYVRTCSNCSHKPKNWNSYEDKILSVFETNKDRIPLIRVSVDLMVLKCWPKSLVQHCFDENFLRKFLSLSKDYNKLDYMNVLSMYQIVKLLHSDHYSGPYPPNDILEKGVSIMAQNKDYILQGALEVGLGGPQYVLNGVRTKLGQVIDYLIVKCKSGEVYSVNTECVKGNCNLSYESLNIPEDSYSIAIVVLNPVSFCLDGIRLRGKIEISLQCLEAYGITAIPISYYQWLETPDCERIPYLMDKINRSVAVTSPHKCSHHNI